jgi:hypothetical protein
MNNMPKKKFDAGQIIGPLQAIEILLSKSKTILEVCCKVGIAEQTFYRSLVNCLIVLGLYCKRVVSTKLLAF